MYLDVRGTLQEIAEVLQLALASSLLFSPLPALPLLHMLGKHLLPVHRSNSLQQHNIVKGRGWGEGTEKDQVVLECKITSSKREL